MRLVLAEPLVKNPAKLDKKKRLGDVGVRMTLGYLAGYLRQEHPDVDVEIIPYKLHELEGLERNLASDLATADIVGITASTTEFYDALTIASEAKRNGNIVIMGGIFPTANADYVLTSPDVDIVVRGEGEKTLSEIVLALKNDGPKADFEKIEGISFRKDHHTIHTPDRGFFPDVNELYPAWDLLQLPRYAQSLNEATVYASRGCSWKCSFCTINQHWRYTHRTKDIEKILEELQLIESHGFEKVRIDDDSIFLNSNYGEELFRQIAARGPRLQYRTKARVNELTPERVKLMKEAGVTMIHFGIESPSQALLNAVRKGMKADQAMETMQMIADYGITINPSFILGIAGETEQSLRDTAEYIKRVADVRPEPSVYTSVMTAHPGTQLHLESRQVGIRIINNDLDDYAHWMLTAIPDSLGEPHYAVQLLAEVQKDILDHTRGQEPPLLVKKILEDNPDLEHLQELRPLT